jgi:hypothetical protein
MSAPAENDNPLEAARELAKAHRLRVVDVHEKKVEAGQVRWLPAWVVYRALPGGASTRLGRRNDPRKLLRFIRTLIGEFTPPH